MGLRRKTQIVTGLVLLGLLMALYAVTRRTLLVQFSRLEEEQTRQNLDRISNAINNELDLLDGSARDDSMWDEAYNYVQHPQPGWGENSFNDDSFVYLRLNGLAYLNAASEPVYAREFDSETREQKVARPEVVEAFVQLARVQQQSGVLSGKGGIVDLPDGPALVAVCGFVFVLWNRPHPLKEIRYAAGLHALISGTSGLTGVVLRGLCDTWSCTVEDLLAPVAERRWSDSQHLPDSTFGPIEGHLLRRPKGPS